MTNTLLSRPYFLPSTCRQTPTIGGIELCDQMLCQQQTLQHASLKKHPGNRALKTSSSLQSQRWGTAAQNCWKEQEVRTAEEEEKKVREPGFGGGGGTALTTTNH
jgi:hypothetical protein